MIRIIVALDIDEATPEDAYASVYRELGIIDAATKGQIQWESTDEWYDSDGEPVGVDAVQRVRDKFFSRLDVEVDSDDTHA